MEDSTNFRPLHTEIIEEDNVDASKRKSLGVRMLWPSMQNDGEPFIPCKN